VKNETIEADVVVAGAGHNSLITAAYLARAGKKVAVIDFRSRPGGGVDTEELIPDFWVDTCSTGHTLLRSNPVLSEDRLGLVEQQHSSCGRNARDERPPGHRGSARPGTAV